MQTLHTLDDLGGIETRAVAPEPTPTRELCREITTRVEVL